MHPAPYQQRSDDVTPILYSCDSIPQVRLYVVVKVKDRSVYAWSVSIPDACCIQVLTIHG
jgi:hypothetical protein